LIISIKEQEVENKEQKRDRRGYIYKD